MPIVDVIIVEKSGASSSSSQTNELADRLGVIFESQPGSTWVRSHSFPADRYAENDRSGEQLDAMLPVFVEVLKRSHDSEHERARESLQIAEQVAEICERKVENVHVLYHPSAAGRIAFGGHLVSTPKRSDETS